MTNDTIMIRIDINALSDVLRSMENIPEDLEPILDKIISTYQRKLEENAREFENGEGDFSACFFEAL